MKYLLSLTIPLLLLSYLVLGGGQQNPASEDRIVALGDGDYANLADYASLTELRNDCGGEAVIGGSCSADCADDCNCETGLFLCRCACGSVPETQHSAQPQDQTSITPPPAESFDRLLEIVGAEDSQTARRFAEDVQRLRASGATPDLAGYDALAEKLDEDVLQLSPATLEKIILEFRAE